ncbi:hypothetical protein ACGFYU_28845 [Streptomyces sp. NPDC048337]|uniref:terpene synthase family protein n=1 Tax=Streptomyces sp. NPDC048337 TaxID=3365535 RepID=UPI00371A53E6
MNTPDMRYTIPAVDRVLPAAWHADTREIIDEVQDWLGSLTGFGSGDHRMITAKDGVLWACAAFPEASVERLLDVGRISAGLFLFDDIHYHDSSHRIETIEGLPLILEGGQPAADPEFPAPLLLADAWQGMSARMTARFRGRIILGFAEYTHGHRSEVDAFQRNSYGALTPSAGAYQELRTRSMGTSLCMMLAEYCSALDASDDMRRHPTLCSILRDLVSDHFLAANGLYSYGKEYAHGDHENNFVHKYMLMGLSRQQGINLTASTVEDAERRLAEFGCWIGEEFGAGSRMAEYVRICQFMCSGSIDYSMVAARYHGPNVPRVDAGPGYAAPSASWTVNLHDHPSRQA